MSLLELKLTLLEDYCKRNEDRWLSEYIREHWKFDFNKINENFKGDIKWPYKLINSKNLKPCSIIV